MSLQFQTKIYASILTKLWTLTSINLMAW